MPDRLTDVANPLRHCTYIAGPGCEQRQRPTNDREAAINITTSNRIRRVAGGAVLAAATALVALGAPAVSHADPGPTAGLGMGCETIHWGAFGMDRRKVCDGPQQPDGTWQRTRTIWTPAFYSPSYCVRSPTLTPAMVCRTTTLTTAADTGLPSPSRIRRPTQWRPIPSYPTSPDGCRRTPTTSCNDLQRLEFAWVRALAAFRYGRRGGAVDPAVGWR